MEYFSGFKWAVPIAFSEAVSLCRFEEGDILYDTAKAYDNDWKKASEQIEQSLQVQYPARASGGATEESGGVFRSNWNSEVRIELYKNLKKLGTGLLSTTQGRLYTALWKGEISVLNNDTDEPPIPLTLQRVTRMLNGVSNRAKEISIGYPVFVMARDLSNQVSREKYSKVLLKLKPHLAEDPTLLSPERAGLTDWAVVAPTIEIVFFPMKGITSEELRELIKQAVYISAKGAKKEMFRISAHGALF